MDNNTVWSLIDTLQNLTCLDYILAQPKGNIRGTVFLIHGYISWCPYELGMNSNHAISWPDLSVGWRYQIPMFQQKGFRVVVPDIIGFGRTVRWSSTSSISNPKKQAPDSIEGYSLKRTADDINALAKQLNCSSIILGGHDWVCQFRNA